MPDRHRTSGLQKSRVDVTDAGANLTLARSAPTLTAETGVQAMKATGPLSGFVHDALLAGRRQDDIRTALTDAGWSVKEVDSALGAWASLPGLPPVPRPQPYVSAREALFFGLLFLSVVVMTFATCRLGFDLIGRALPDAQITMDAVGVRSSVASILTFVPLFLILDRRTRIGAVGDGTGPRRSLVRRWIASFALFIASLTLLGDLALAIFTLLNGELTLRFVLKSLLVALVAGLVLAYFREEMDEDA